MINEFLAEVQQLQEANEMMATIIEANDYQEKLDLAISLYEASDTSIMESANGDINAIFKDLQKQYKNGVKEAKAAIKTGDTKAAKAKINDLIKICEEGKKKVSAVEGGNGSGFFKSFGLGITTATLSLAAGTATFFGGTAAVINKAGDAADKHFGSVGNNASKINAKVDKAVAKVQANGKLSGEESFEKQLAIRKAGNDKIAKNSERNHNRREMANTVSGKTGEFLDKHGKKVAIAAAAVAAIATLTAVVKGLKTSHDTKANDREGSGNAYKDEVLNALDADINQLKKLASSL